MNEPEDESFNSNYVHVKPNSHFYPHIDYILTTLKYYPSTFSTEKDFIEHLRIGLENTKKQGYYLTKEKKTTDTDETDG